MNTVSVIAASIVFTLAVLWIAVGLAGLTKRLPRNRWLGVRAPQTLATADRFALANRIAAPGYLGAGAVLILSGVFALGGRWGFLFALGGLVVATLILSAIGGIALRTVNALPEPAADGCGCCSAEPTADVAATSACGPTACGPATPTANPAADCGTSSCGSCALNGMCESTAQA